MSARTSASGMDGLWVGSPDFLDSQPTNGKTPAFGNSSPKLGHACGATGFVTSTNVDAARTRHSKNISPKFGKRHRYLREQWRLPVSNFHPSNQKGILTVQLALTWTPVLAIFGVILWMRAAAIKQIDRQRTLDRCLFSVLEKRCSTLSHLSTTNQTLRKIVQALALLETTKNVSVVIPGVGAVVNGVLGTSAQIARASAQTLVQYQNLLMAFEAASALAAWKCGVPTKGWLPLVFSRPLTQESIWAKCAAPLKWERGASSSEVSVLGRDFSTQSFGHCRPTEFLDVLNGEKYDVSFQHAEKEAKSDLKPSFSWQ